MYLVCIIIVLSRYMISVYTYLVIKFDFDLEILSQK